MTIVGKVFNIFILPIKLEASLMNETIVHDCPNVRKKMNIFSTSSCKTCTEFELYEFLSNKMKYFSSTS